MQLKLIDLFKSIRWAKNGDLTDFSQTNYEAGWAHLGDDTPTVQDFNYVQAMNDQKDQWLFAQINEVLKAQGIEATEDDLPALKRAIENLVTAKSTPKTITSATKNTFDNNGHSHEIDKASTTQAGIVQLTDDYNGNSKTLGLAQNAGRALKAFIDSIVRNLNNYIPNSKKSNAVDSASSDTVATSVAVKAAYDKGVEGLNAANNANNNANGRVSKSGDTMTGSLTLPTLIVGYIQSNNWLDIRAKNGVAIYGDSGTSPIINLNANQSIFEKEIQSNSGITTKQKGFGGYGDQFLKGAPYYVESLGGQRINTYHPFIKGRVRELGDSGASFSLGYTSYQPGYYEYGQFGRGVINLTEDNGSYKNWEFEHSGNFRSAGDVVTNSGASLNSAQSFIDGNRYVKQIGGNNIQQWWDGQTLKLKVDSSDLGNIVLARDFAITWYGSHYEGAEVYKSKYSQNMQIRMNLGVVNASGTFFLPEAFTGAATVVATDSGGAANPVGSSFMGGNVIHIAVTKPTRVSVIVIGTKA